MKKRLSLMLLCMFATIVAWAQTVITGTVVSASDGEPLIGASVKVKGTKTQAVTNLDGKFSIKAEQGTTLVFSYIAMETLERAAKNGMLVELQQADKIMDEVMVVAYGTQKKSSFTGSAVEIKSDDISSHVASSATSALVGKVAGVSATVGDGGPGSGPTIRIRGIGSMSASSSPLYIVDGAPYENAIATINPSDIASISVLKDAAASAIYGARGANGVIIITTKRAQAGSDPNINFEARWGSNSRLVPQYDVIDNPAQYYETQYRALYNSKAYWGSTPAEAYAFADAALLDGNNGGLGYQVYTIPEGQIMIGRNFKLNPNAKLGYSDGEYTYLPDNWYDETFHSSFRQEYNLSASGATERFNYYANLGYLYDGGFVDKSSYSRYSARLNGDYKIKDWLTFSSQMGFTHGVSEFPMYDTESWGSTGNLFYICNNMAPIYPLYVRDANGNIMKENGRIIYDANQTNFQRPSLLGNAVRDNDYNTDKSLSDLFNGRWNLTATPVKGLTLSASFNVSSYNSRATSLSSPFGSASSVDGSVYVRSTRKFTTNQNYLARYETTIAKHHNLNVMLGYEQYRLTESSLSAYNDHLFSPTISELDNALGFKQKQLGSYTDHYMTQGIFGQAQYDYDEKYVLSASYRRDASSCFAPGHRWGNFGSVGAAWQISKMDFMKNAKWVNFLKLKLSFGVQGNDGVGYYTYANRYKATYNDDTGEYTINMSEMGNENLTWESSHSWNLGLDFALFNHHLSGSVDFYHRNTSDMLYFLYTPLSSGISAEGYYTNLGSMYNRGIEVTLNGNIFRTRDFKWDIDLNLTHNANKITDLDGEERRSSYNILYEGGSIYQAYMIKYAGTDKENGRAMYYKDVKDNAGKITGRTTTYDMTEATKYDCGSTLAKLVGGFGTSLSYKGLDVSAQFSYSLGGRIYDGTYQALMHNGRSAGSAMHKDLLNAWSPENPSSNIPRLSTASADDPGSGSQTPIDRFLTSSNYLTLNNLTIGYTFPRKWMSRAKISNLRVYVAGENLFLLTARKGLDPRFNGGLGSMTYGSGMNTSSYAGSRTITAGLSLQF